MNKKNHNILAVCSTLDYKNYTRRATIEAIRKLHPNLDILLFNGITSLWKTKTLHGDAAFSTHHSWLPESVSQSWKLGPIESALRSIPRKRYFNQYDTLFLTDPNQYRLLPFIGDQQLVYLVRDPNVLQNKRHLTGEKKLLERAGLVLATSKNLAERYVSKYHNMNHSNNRYWPNCVDLSVWSEDRMAKMGNKKRPVAGVAGNFGAKRTDYELLKTITSELSHMDFVIAGNIDREACPEFWKKLLGQENVIYKGFIPHDELPAEVTGWDVGLVTDRLDEYTSYMHHNKVYQYLAMGVPVVSMKIHDDYNSLSPYVQTAEEYQGFSKAIGAALEFQKDEEFRRGCREKAVQNSAHMRAKQFLQLLNNI